MFLVGWLPDSPDQISIHTIILSYPTPFLSHLVFSSVTQSQLTGASLSAFSLLHSQPSPSLSSSSLFTVKLLSSSSFFTIKLLARAHGSFFTGTVKLSLLSLGVCLGKNSQSRGGSRSGERSGEISPDIARSHRI
jgi:hypothetical protein